MVNVSPESILDYIEENYSDGKMFSTKELAEGLDDRRNRIKSQMVIVVERSKDSRDFDIIKTPNRNPILWVVDRSGDDEGSTEDDEIEPDEFRGHEQFFRKWFAEMLAYLDNKPNYAPEASEEIGMPESTFHRKAKDMVDEGLVEIEAVVSGKGRPKKLYRITEKGSEFVSALEEAFGVE
jgi:predicted transcriptional regulator